MQLSKGFPFTFGLDKARAILANVDDIRRFVAEHDNAPKGWRKIEGGGETDPGELAADRWNETQGGNGGAL